MFGGILETRRNEKKKKENRKSTQENVNHRKQQFELNYSYAFHDERKISKLFFFSFFSKRDLLFKGDEDVSSE